MAADLGHCIGISDRNPRAFEVIKTPSAYALMRPRMLALRSGSSCLATSLERSELPRPSPKTEQRILTHDEITKLLDNALPSYRAVLATGVFTGMRLQELLGLRWRDVDFANGFIRVRHQLSRAKTGKPGRLVPLKTAAGRRDVVRLPQLGSLLKRHRLATRFSTESDFVFSTEVGTPFYYRNISSRGLDKAADRAGLNAGDAPKLTMHDLRHTFASHLILDLKLDVAQVSKLLGHARPSITLDVYTHVFDRARHADDIRAPMADSAFGGLLEGAF